MLADIITLALGELECWPICLGMLSRGVYYVTCKGVHSVSTLADHLMPNVLASYITCMHRCGSHNLPKSTLEFSQTKYKAPEQSPTCS